MISLTIPSPCDPLNSNERLHFAVKAKRTRAWRDMAHDHAAYLADHGQRLTHAHVTATCHFTDNRRRDAGNWYPTAKACLDGAVDAGLLPDDSDRYVIGPDMRAGDKADVFTLTLTLDPDCGCRSCAHQFGPRLSLITNQGE